MDERDKQDREEWEKRQNPSQDKPPRKTELKSQKKKAPRDWERRLEWNYSLDSFAIWIVRIATFIVIAAGVYNSFVIAVPFIINYGTNRFDAEYRAPIYICELRNAELQYNKSDLFKDYYNFRRNEIYHYQREIWELDGQLRKIYPDNAFIIDIPPMPDDYTTDNEVFKRYGVSDGRKKYRKFVDVADYFTPIRAVPKGILITSCLYEESATRDPVRQKHYIEYVSKQIGTCRTCDGVKAGNATSEKVVPAANPNNLPVWDRTPSTESNPNGLPLWDRNPLSSDEN